VCAKWTIDADVDSDYSEFKGVCEEIGLEMLHPWAVAVTQGEARIVVTPKQLSALTDKLYCLNEIYRADVQEAVECLM
jgi:hypothetical protein